MPRRSGARPRTAPLASLALALSTLIALAALPGGAAAKRASATGTLEATPVGEVAPTPAAARAAERAARRAERSAAEAEAGAASAQTVASGTSARDAREAARAEKHAEHVAKREARHAAASGAAAPSAARAGAQAVAGGAGKAQKTHLEKQREHEKLHEQRARERETKGRLRGEGHKEREAREAREAEEGVEAEPSAGGAGGGQRVATAARGVSVGPGGEATSRAPSASAVASVRIGHPAGSSHRARARHARNGSTGQAAGPTALTAIGLGALAAPAAGTAGGGGASASHAKHAAPHGGQASESPIVKTVTQIVGVIPTALWLLIGVLAFAAAAFAVTSRLAARRAARLDRQRRSLLEDVGLLQAALLPELPERLGPVGTSAAYRPASGPGAGGDFYDVFALPDGLLAVIVGDVSGHGRDALPHTTLLRYTLRAYLEAGLSPREALRAAAPALERQLGGSFATVVLASYDPRARVLTYSSAGHPHPIVTGLDPDAMIIAGSAPPIGTGRATGSRQTVVSIPGAATACFYTDGVIEARTAGRLYGQRRLAAALGSVRAGARDSGPAAAELLDRVADETDRRPDDMAACLLNLAGEHATPRVLEEQLVLDTRDADGKRARRFLVAAGLEEAEIATTVARARAIAAEHGSALLELDVSGERPRVSVLQDNVAPLRARALARTQEVAL